MMMKTPFVTGRLYSDAFKLGLEVRESSLDEIVESLLTREKTNQEMSKVYNMIYLLYIYIFFYGITDGISWYNRYRSAKNV